MLEGAMTESNSENITRQEGTPRDNIPPPRLRSLLIMTLSLNDDLTGY